MREDSSGCVRAKRALVPRHRAVVRNGAMRFAYCALLRPTVTGPSAAILPLYHCHVGSDRVGNEAILVRRVVHSIEFFHIWYAVPAPRELRAQLDASDRQLALRILLHKADRLILVRV